jgi:hypothetical protein
VTELHERIFDTFFLFLRVVSFSSVSVLRSIPLGKYGVMKMFSTFSHRDTKTNSFLLTDFYPSHLKEEKLSQSVIGVVVSRTPN